MNLWINSRATHWTEDSIVHVYCVMDGAFRVTEWKESRDNAVREMERIQEQVSILALAS